MLTTVQDMKATALATCGVIVLAALCISPTAHSSDVGKRFPSEQRILVDMVTGVTITALTNSSSNDSKNYQTHPQWTSDGEYIIFRSNRAKVGRSQAFAVHEESGSIIQITDGEGTQTGSLNIARNSNRLYFFRGNRGEPGQLVEVGLDSLLSDSQAGTMKDPASYERIIMTMPEGLRESGGFTLDADEKVAYVGVSRGTDLGGIRSIDLQTGAISTVIDVPFRMGHVQANPWVTGEIMYCHETGGDAPQRMWFVRADGSDNHPLYVETPDEWVTHEIFVDSDHVLFNVMAHLPRLRTKPTGILSLDIRTNEVKVISQVTEGRGFWHCSGSPDGRWAAGDNFTGNIYLIDRTSGETTLLTTNHRMKPDHAHPNFSPDIKRILFQSGLLSDGASLDLMTVTIPSLLQN